MLRGPSCHDDAEKPESVVSLEAAAWDMGEAIAGTLDFSSAIIYGSGPQGDLRVQCDRASQTQHGPKTSSGWVSPFGTEESLGESFSCESGLPRVQSSQQIPDLNTLMCSQPCGA